MHGRPRLSQSDQNDPARVQAAQEKAKLLGKLLGAVLQRRKDRQYDTESLSLSAKLLELNPEVYTVWNYRREAINPILEQGGEAAVEAVKIELELSQKALMRNPKSYSTWHHRKWIIALGFSSLQHELELVEQLLNADSRNFHGWSYRKFIAERMGMPVEQELAYTKKKIEQNFSNYSAWHYRTHLLPLKYSDESTTQAAGTASIPVDVLSKEYELVKQAFYTEPEDQSGWFYHRWLQGCSLARLHASTTTKDAEERQGLIDTLDKEIAMCRELLEIEPNAKWPLLTLTRLQEIKLQVVSDAGELSGEIKEAYKTLGEEDHMRSGYYLDATEGRAHVVAVPSTPTV